nr:Beta-lactamase [uncultured bacterium]
MKINFKSALYFLTTFLCMIPSFLLAAVDQKDMINKAVHTFMEKNQIPGVAVEVFNDGEPNSYYFGLANQEKKIPVSGKTIFELGSISKLMTSLLLAQEVDFANLQLNTPLREVLKDLPETFNNVTLQSLATHVSGLPFRPSQPINDRVELEKYLNGFPKITLPDKQWAYSNFGINVLGYALETSTHKDFYQLYRSHILAPLKMQNLSEPKRKVSGFIAQGYDKEGKPASAVGPGLLPAAGGLKASAEDMQRFLSAAIGLPKTPMRIFYPMRMTQSIYVKLSNHMQGLGWQIHPMDKSKIGNLFTEATNPLALGTLNVLEIEQRPMFDPNALIDKTGGTDGFRSYIAVIPNKKSGVVILANKFVPSDEIVKLGREILLKMTNIIDT